MLWLLLLLAAAPDAGCIPPAPDAVVKVSFKPGATGEALVRFAAATLCETSRLPAAARSLPLGLSIEGELHGRQLGALLRLLEQSVGVEPAAAPAPEPAASCDPGLVSAITPVDPWTRVVKATALAGLKECGARTRTVPSLKDGKVEGFKVFGIRPGSVVEALAFQNGDVVLSVNGAPLSGPAQVLSAWEQHRRAPVVKFSVLRKGEPRTITWKIK